MTGYLLDTHALHWLVVEDPRLGESTRAALSAASVSFSAVSVWELEIKKGRGRMVVPERLDERLRAAGLTELPLTARHAQAIGEIEVRHHDPFDRLLLAQAAVEGLVFVTADRQILALGRPGVVDARA